MMGRKMGQIMVICLMAMISTRSSAFGDSRSMGDTPKPLGNGEDNKSPIKKAYTYVSEYKRLPVFNFGIGKRWADISGIKGAQPYSFGFGKRSTSANAYPMRMGLDYLPYENYMNDDMATDPREENKRSGRLRLYDFGLGKRMVPSQLGAANYANDHVDYEGLKKHLNDDFVQRFLYGLNNRFGDEQEDPQQED